MTKRELFDRLHRVEDINTALLCVQMQIEKLESCLQGHAIRYDKDRVQTSPKDAVAEVMCNLEALLKKQTKLQIELTAAVADVANLIGQLKNNKQALVMHCRYTSGMSWPKIAARVQCSERHVFRIHDDAVKWLCKNN